MKPNEGLVIAIDGPSASGKSTVSRQVAQALAFIYVDSGSLYRGMTWKAVQSGVDVRDAEAVVRMMNESKWEFFIEERVVYFQIDGVDPRDFLRKEAVRERVSDVAAIPEVRRFIVARLREMSDFGSIVMEGRDIGSVVFPETSWKYYLDADPEERARRRFKELQVSESAACVQSVKDSLLRRDHKDTTRATAPLQIALGAKVVNTTNMGIDDVVQMIVSEVNRSNG
ncbi:MAG: (d)CMP kinase [Kiritimatiellae bacterium]|nr:(d)CMP kinase [Kiritimatiellia bacterium]